MFVYVIRCDAARCDIGHVGQPENSFSTTWGPGTFHNGTSWVSKKVYRKVFKQVSRKVSRKISSKSVQTCLQKMWEKEAQKVSKKGVWKVSKEVSISSQ